MIFKGNKTPVMYCVLYIIEIKFKDYRMLIMTINY